MGLKPVEDALAEMLRRCTPLSEEEVALESARDRFLSRTLPCKSDWPAFDNSAMDGYAIVAADVVQTPSTLTVAGESRAGGPAPTALATGCAMRIFTGAPMPQGADTVVMQEDTTRDDDRVTIRLTPRPGQHVRRRGGDLTAGQPLLDAGSHIGPFAIAVLASQRYARVPVHRRPEVAIVSTGDELREPDAPEEPGTVVNSNAYALAAQVQEAGAIPRVLPIAADRVEVLTELLRDALSSEVVITTGGVSVGDYDHVHEAFDRLGVETSFWKVRIKPGKPVRFGIHGDTPVVGLPGNPVSALATFEILVRPCLRRLLGDPKPFRAPVRVRLAREHHRKAGRLELARARLERDDTGWIAHLHDKQGSGSLASIAVADVLVVLPHDRADFAAADVLNAIPLRPMGSAELVI